MDSAFTSNDIGTYPGFQSQSSFPEARVAEGAAEPISEATEGAAVVVGCGCTLQRRP